jgi:hypothetical protein
VQALQDQAEIDQKHIRIPKAFFDESAHFLSPFITGDTDEKFYVLLQMDEAEIEVADAATAAATALAQEYERANLVNDATPDGFPIYRIPAWGALGEEIVRNMRRELTNALGAERSAYFVDGYVVKEVLRKADQSLEIIAKPGGDGRPYPSLQVQLKRPETGSVEGGDYMV